MKVSLKSEMVRLNLKIVCLVWHGMTHKCKVFGILYQRNPQVKLLFSAKIIYAVTTNMITLYMNG